MYMLLKIHENLLKILINFAKHFDKFHLKCSQKPLRIFCKFSLKFHKKYFE